MSLFVELKRRNVIRDRVGDPSSPELEVSP